MNVASSPEVLVGLTFSSLYSEILTILTTVCPGKGVACDESDTKRMAETLPGSVL
jgi:hypothetical protein